MKRSADDGTLIIDEMGTKEYRKHIKNPTARETNKLPKQHENKHREKRSYDQIIDESLIQNLEKTFLPLIRFKMGEIVKTIESMLGTIDDDFPAHLDYFENKHREKRSYDQIIDESLIRNLEKTFLLLIRFKMGEIVKSIESMLGTIDDDFPDNLDYLENKTS